MGEKGKGEKINKMETSLAPDSASGYVLPKETCEHLDEHVKIEKCVSADQKCSQCDTDKEIWLCLACDQYYCGRFISRHMVDHSMSEYHLIAMSLSDLSFWCYVCDCYIINTNPKLLPIYSSAHLLKFNAPCPV